MKENKKVSNSGNTINNDTISGNDVDGYEIAISTTAADNKTKESTDLSFTKNRMFFVPDFHGVCTLCQYRLLVYAL